VEGSHGNLEGGKLLTLTVHTVTGQGYFQTLTMRVILEIYGSWTISPGVTSDFVFETR
jgi:hypothetical protein